MRHINKQMECSIILEKYFNILNVRSWHRADRQESVFRDAACKTFWGLAERKGKQMSNIGHVLLLLN